jgi:phosphate transport system substrate-binding protein
MFSEYNKATGLKINYQSIGSGGGILQITNKTVDFGASDAPLNEEQETKIGAPVLHVPMTSGAVVISYNLPGIQDTLNMTGDILANIFLGKIKKWNDPSIVSLNKSVKLPNMDLVVAHRSDGSGTTYSFVDYLSKISDEWKTKVGKATSVNWPVGVGGKGNEGVAGLVRQTPGAIGYIELAYAYQNKMSIARIKNKAGNFVSPTIASITAASDVQMPADAKISITNADAPQGYPISTLTWALIYKEQKYDDRSAAKANNLLKLLWWNIHDGQQYAAPLTYAPLSKAAVTVGENILKSATYDGKAILQ